MPYWHYVPCSVISVIAQCINVLYWYSFQCSGIFIIAQFKAVHVYVHICIQFITIYKCVFDHILSEVYVHYSIFVNKFVNYCLYFKVGEYLPDWEYLHCWQLLLHQGDQKCH